MMMKENQFLSENKIDKSARRRTIFFASPIYFPERVEETSSRVKTCGDPWVSIFYKVEESKEQALHR